MQWTVSRAAARADADSAMTTFLSELDRQYRPGGEGVPLAGFSFLQDAREMLRISREIERNISASPRGAKLYAGFQNASKFEVERLRYAALRAAGVAVHAFGEGDPPSDGSTSLDSWTALSRDVELLENQWYLVTKRPAPIAFVGWEVSEDELWGEHGATHPDKRFVGFVSEDARIVQALISHLDGVRARETGVSQVSRSRVAPSSSTAAAAPSAPSLSLDELIRSSGARRILVFVDDGKRPALKRTLERVTSTSGAGELSLSLYDLASGSYLVDPYKWPSDRKPLEADYVERALGRGYLAEQIRQADVSTVEARGLLAPGVGFKHVAEWVERGVVEAVVVPDDFERPSLVDRIGGYTTGALRQLGVPVIVVENDGHARNLEGTTSRVRAVPRGSGADATHA